MLSKSKYFDRLLLVLDNLCGVFAWLFLLNIAMLFDRISESSFYQHASLLLFIAPLQMLALSVNRAPSLRLAAQATALGKAFGAVLLGVFALVFVAKLDFVSRLVVFGYGLMSFVGLLTVKAFLRYWYFHGRKEREENYTKVLIVGTGPRAQEVAEQLRSGGSWGTEIVGFLDPDPDFLSRQMRLKNGTDGASHASGATEVMAAPLAAPIFSADRIAEVLASTVVDEVVIALPRKLLGEIEDVVQICEQEGIRTRLVADIYNINVANTEMSMLGQVPVLDFQPVAHNANMLLVKRIFDLVSTIAALPLLVPLFLLIGLAIKLDSKGPVFFMQERIGLNKRRFRMFKFRSMYEDAEARLSEVEHLNEAEGPIFKIRNDPRVTRVGKFIRRTSLDELPQLINVLLGHMSIVGPRPMSVRDVSLFDKSIQRRRFSVRPGCTCLWQISGRSNLPFEKWLELDLQYINNWSVILDLKILLKTVPSLIKGEGAV